MFLSNRITLFREQYEAISKLPVAIQGKVYKALMDYNFSGNVPKLYGTAQLAFDLIKAGLDVSLSKQRAGQAGGNQKASNSLAESKQELSRSLADEDSKDLAECKQKSSKVLAEVKQNASSIEKSSIDREDSIESKENNKESKYVSKNNNSGVSGARMQSYESIMDDLMVDELVRPMLWEFIKHCQANGHTLINSKLSDIIIRLDIAYGDSTSQKIESLKKAIAGGYYDIAELRG